MSSQFPREPSSSRDTQDLFKLIGGSWPPAPKEPESSKYGTVPRTKKTTYMQQPSRQRVKSVNLISHLTLDKKHKSNSQATLQRKSANSQSQEHKIKHKMVHEPKKIETGILVDVAPNAGLCRPEELYDQPQFGSPRAVSQRRSASPLHLQDDIGVGSLVEVATDVDQTYYGVVRWIGLIDDTATAGVELEENVPGLGDGQRNDQRVFSCPPGRALFVPLALCRSDSRFRDTPSASDASDAHDALHPDQPDCPLVTGVVPPLTSLNDLVGKNRGIQGHHNSCYLDATLFAMFTFTSVFDALLYRPPEPEFYLTGVSTKSCFAALAALKNDKPNLLKLNKSQRYVVFPGGHPSKYRPCPTLLIKDCAQYSEVQRVLREEVVNPLRKHGYVRADRVMKLRTLLEKLSDVTGLTSEEKDPEEFLNGLVAQILRAEPFLKLSSGQEAFCYQLFVEKDEQVTLPTVQQLLEQSFATSGVKLSEVPATLIIQMPRFGKNYKLYPRLLPSAVLDVTDLIEGPRACCVCGLLARWECAMCAGRGGAGLEGTAYCGACLTRAHPPVLQHAQPKPLSINEEYITILECCPIPRVYMELFAVLCIETSHYVAFVKAGSGHDAAWCLFDSMADRKGERNGYNIPEIVEVEGALWTSEEGALALHAASPHDRHLPPHAKRLLADAYMCFYRSPDATMYR